MAMVAAIFPGGVQPHYHLIPLPIFAQVLGEACQGAFGQPLKFSHHLLALVHGVETMDPKHDLNLDFQGQHITKRLVLRIHQPSAVHDDSVKHEMGPLRADPFSYPLFGPITTSRQDLGSTPKKVYPWGAPPRVSSRGQSPHVISLHQSAPLIESLNPVARLVFAHSSLISHAVQDGQLTPVAGVVLGADCDPV